jgi:hypothetical protein
MTDSWIVFFPKEKERKNFWINQMWKSDSLRDAESKKEAGEMNWNALESLFLSFFFLVA